MCKTERLKFLQLMHHLKSLRNDIQGAINNGSLNGINANEEHLEAFLQDLNNNYDGAWQLGQELVQANETKILEDVAHMLK